MLLFFVQTAEWINIAKTYFLEHMVLLLPLKPNRVRISWIKKIKMIHRSKLCQTVSSSESDTAELDHSKDSVPLSNVQGKVSLDKRHEEPEIYDRKNDFWW
jgi:hypothetical protein